MFMGTLAGNPTGRPPRRKPAVDPRACSACGRWKPLSAYHCTGKTKLGHPIYKRKCRACRSEARRSERQADLSAARALDRERYHTKRKQDPNRKERTRNAARRARSSNPARFLEAGWRAQGIQGFSYPDYLLLLAQQNGGCRICRRVTLPLHVDHSHASGRVRGLLCGSCNRALGQFQEDPVRLTAALGYLQLHEVYDRIAKAGDQALALTGEQA